MERTHKKLPEKNVSLVDLAAELNLTYKGAYERLKKFVEYIGGNIKNFKSTDNKILFYKDEKEVIRTLLEEMGESFMIALTSKRATGKSQEEIYKNTLGFLSRMDVVIENIEDEDIRYNWKSIIQLISKSEASKIQAEIVEKINKMGKRLDGLAYEDMIKVLSNINSKLDYWIDTHYESLFKDLINKRV